MPTAITIPISMFELAIGYQKPELRLLADRARPVQALFDAFAPWTPRLDDMEIITAGRHSEQGVKIRINGQGASFFFGALGCRFTQENATWDHAANLQELVTIALNTLATSTGVIFGTKTSIVSRHLQPETGSFKDILRNFIVPGIQNLAQEPAIAMAIVARWPKRRITLDGSAALANAIFLQTEREFDSAVSLEQIQKTLWAERQELFELLGVAEVQA
jgi:hypothetical protein